MTNGTTELIPCPDCGVDIAAQFAAGDETAVATCGCGFSEWVIRSSEPTTRPGILPCPGCNRILDLDRDKSLTTGELVCPDCAYRITAGARQQLLTVEDSFPPVAETPVQEARRLLQNNVTIDGYSAVNKVIARVAVLALDRVDQYLRHRKQLDRTSTFLKHYHGDHSAAALEDFQRVLDHFDQKDS